VFEQQSIRILANYSVAQATELTPPAGTALDPWLGELILVPAACDASTLLGKTLHVTLLWRLNAAITQDPPTGVYLGGYEEGKQTVFDDARLLYPGTTSAGSSTPRSLNSLTPMELSHTFSTAPEAVAAARGGVYLRVYLLTPEVAVPSTLYVGDIDWK
jgi:hypothetical protein